MVQRRCRVQAVAEKVTGPNCAGYSGFAKYASIVMVSLCYVPPVWSLLVEFTAGVPVLVDVY